MRSSLLPLLSVALVATAAATGHLLSRSDGGPAARPAQQLTLRGDVDGLWPGSTRDLVVQVTNRTGRDVVLERVDARVTDPTRGCPTEQLRLEPWSGRRTLPGRGTVQVPLRAQLSADAPDACAGASFGLALRGTATRSAR